MINVQPCISSEWLASTPTEAGDAATDSGGGVRDLRQGNTCKLDRRYGHRVQRHRRRSSGLTSSGHWWIWQNGSSRRRARTSAGSWRLPCRSATRKNMHEPRRHPPGKQEPIDPVLHPPPHPLPSLSSGGSRPANCGRAPATNLRMILNEWKPFGIVTYNLKAHVQQRCGNDPRTRVGNGSTQTPKYYQ